MKTTTVPAQITTVEDKVAGNLSFTQLLLFTTPVFLSGAIFALIPPFMNLNAFKLVVCIFVALVFMLLAVRIKGKILLSWVSVIGRYNYRPRYYVFNKNDSYHRTKKQATVELDDVVVATDTVQVRMPTLIPIPEIVRLETALSDPRAKFHFKTTKKGDLRVVIQEIK